jgi:hypothetical protein
MGPGLADEALTRQCRAVKPTSNDESKCFVSCQRFAMSFSANNEDATGLQ